MHSARALNSSTIRIVQDWQIALQAWAPAFFDRFGMIFGGLTCDFMPLKTDARMDK